MEKRQGEGKEGESGRGIGQGAEGWVRTNGGVGFNVFMTSSMQITRSERKGGGG